MYLPSDRPTEELLVALRERAATIIQQEFAAPGYKLKELVTGVVNELNNESGDSKKLNNAVRILKDNPELLASIEREVGPNAKFGFAGIGDNALVLTYDNAEGRRQILRITTASEGRFEGSEHVLQPHKQKTVGPLKVGHSYIALSLNTVIDDNRRPRAGLTNHTVMSQSEADKVMRLLQGSLYNDGLFLFDDHHGNVAITADGKIVAPDPGSIRTVEEHKKRIETLEGEAKAAAQKRFDAVVTEAERIKTSTPVLTSAIGEPTTKGTIEDARRLGTSQQTTRLRTDVAPKGRIPGGIPGLVIGGFVGGAVTLATKPATAHNLAVGAANGAVPGLGYLAEGNYGEAAVDFGIGAVSIGAGAVAGIAGAPAVGIIATGLVAGVAVQKGGEKLGDLFAEHVLGVDTNPAPLSLLNVPSTGADSFVGDCGNVPSNLPPAAARAARIAGSKVIEQLVGTAEQVAANDKAKPTGAKVEFRQF